MVSKFRTLPLVDLLKPLIQRTDDVYFWLTKQAMHIPSSNIKLDSLILVSWILNFRWEKETELISWRKFERVWLMELKVEKLLCFILVRINLMLIKCWREKNSGTQNNFSEVHKKWIVNGIEQTSWSQQIWILLEMKELFIPVISSSFLCPYHKRHPLKTSNGLQVVKINSEVSQFLDSIKNHSSFISDKWIIVHHFKL